MKVHLTFDVEVWCNGWDDLDGRFPAAFDRYVYGRSARGEYALPATLEILQRHGLRGTFFVEPLFSARFGPQYLERIVRLIEDAGQDVQLHLHPEWTDELATPPIADASRKRQHLYHYTRDEQEQLLRYALGLLRTHARSNVHAFRAGSYAANADTYRALQAVGLTVDSSLNRASDDSGRDLAEVRDPRSAFMLGGVQVYPVTVFRDGRGRDRPAQVGACGLAEMVQALASAHALGRRHFVIVSHNFEMLHPGAATPTASSCAASKGCAATWPNTVTATTPARWNPAAPLDDAATGVPAVGTGATLMRLAAQAARRWG